MRVEARLGLWGLVLVASVQLACATVPACPAKGGPAWRELTSDHFVLRTDLEAEDALTVLRRLEDTRAAMLAIVWPRAPALRGRIQAYALASREEVAVYLGPHSAAVHMRRPPFPPTLLIAGPGAQSQLDANHELAHALSFKLLPLQPPWFAEGLADYLSTIHRHREGGDSVMAGDALLSHYLFVRRYGLSSLETLLGPIPEDQSERWKFYASSWLLFHYLINNRPDALGRFQRRLGALQPGPKAFETEFPDLAAGKLEGVLRGYAFAGKYTVAVRPLPAWAGRYEPRILSDAEVHASRGFLEAQLGSTRGDGDGWLVAARADVGEALQDAHPPIDALVLAFYEPRLAPSVSRQDLAKRAVEAHPDHWMSWLLAAKAAPDDSAERQQALHHALAVSPDEPEVLASLAVELARAKQWDQVLLITNEILGLGAQHPELWMLHLAALSYTGHCQAAQTWGAALQGYAKPQGARAIAAARAKLSCRPSG